MNPPNRRSFLKAVAGGGAGLLATTAAVSASTQPINNREWGMLYDATRCVGCKACMAACKRVNGDTGALAYEQAEFDSDALWDAPKDLSGDTRTIIKLQKEGARWSYIKYSCMHCQKPSCVSVCPVRAMTKDATTGVVDYSKDTCIGCRYCQIACPFNIPKFQWDRTVPRIVKCDLCAKTNLKAKGTTACAETCPTGAILFGTRQDLLGEAHRRLREQPERYVPRVYGEMEVGGTNHLYLAGLPFSQLGLPELPTEAPAVFSERIQHTIYKGFMAPVALYGALCVVALKNLKQHEEPPGAARSSGKGD